MVFELFFLLRDSATQELLGILCELFNIEIAS